MTIFPPHLFFSFSGGALLLVVVTVMSGDCLRLVLSFSAIRV